MEYTLLNKIIKNCYEIDNPAYIGSDILDKIRALLGSDTFMVILPKDEHGNLKVFLQEQNCDFIKKYIGQILPVVYDFHINLPLEKINIFEIDKFRTSNDLLPSLEITNKTLIERLSPKIEYFIKNIANEFQINSGIIQHCKLSNINNINKDVIFLQGYIKKSNKKSFDENTYKIISYHLQLLFERIIINSDFSNSFTNREKQIISLLMEGFENNEIGSILDISINTVKTMISNIYLKTGTVNRASLVFYVMSKGFQKIPFNSEQSKLIPTIKNDNTIYNIFIQ